jgi:flagellar L-ring protein precursor FlgH
MKAPAAFAAFWFLAIGPAEADNLYASGNWSAMASDRIAHAVGDILTVVIYENASAQNSASSGSKRSSQAGGNLSSNTKFNYSGSLGIQNTSDDSGTTGRSGGMVAQISVTIVRVLPNGDFQVFGEQQLNINGDKTNIRIKGRVRQADISNNAVLSTRLADAVIDYDGTGFVSKSAKAGFLTRIFNWLGLS